MIGFSAPAASPPRGRAGVVVLPASTSAPVEDDDTHLDCAAALAIIRNQFADAHRRVDTAAARFLADCQQHAQHIDGAV